MAEKALELADIQEKMSGLEFLNLWKARKDRLRAQNPQLTEKELNQVVARIAFKHMTYGETGRLLLWVLNDLTK